MFSSIATLEPLPLVPPTVITTKGGASACRHRHTARTRSRPRSILLGCRPSCQCSQASSVVWRAAADRSSVMSCSPAVAQRRLPHHGAGWWVNIARMLAIRSRMSRRTTIKSRALLLQKLAALKALGQGLALGLLDHARARETDEGVGLADVHVAQHREARGDAAHGGIGHHGDEREAFFAETRERGAGLGH